ncbi:hypothetical protein SB14R_10310 [Pseudomonas oryzihabitans]|nr:hypothetical protein SB14R_10310 [Pseudomonas psychrotolerans]
MSEPSNHIFTISYDADGDLQDHKIDAKVLGQAIVSMDELITEAAKIVSNGSSEADLKVVAPAKEGSLEIVYSIVSDQQTANAVMAALGIGAGLVAAGTATALSVIERIKDKKIDRISVSNKKAHKATIEVDGEEIETPIAVANLVSNRAIRQALHNTIFAPLKGKENAKVSFVTGENAKVELHEESVKSIVPLKSGSLEQVKINVFQKVVSFTKLNFKSRSSWSIQSADGFEAGVTIADKNFFDKVNANQEAFQKDKLYTVEIEHKETKGPSGDRNSYKIIRVINEFNP